MTLSTNARDIVTGAAPSVGTPMDRVDGRLKVTGSARYAAEFPMSNIAHAVIVTSTVPVGRVSAIDTRAAEAVPGVIRVMTHLNAPKLPMKKVGMFGTNALSLMQDDRVRYNGQPIALVIADTLERATDAASLVKVRYGGTRAPTLDMHANKGTGYAPPPGFGGQPDSKRGNVPAGLAQADVKVDAQYTTPIENHNPMEPHATIASWEGGRLTVWDASQYVIGERDSLAGVFGLTPESVRVVSHFVGGGFGCKGLMWSQSPLAAMAAREVSRPVKLVLTRRQMYGPVGARPQTEQHVVLGATRDGTLTAVRHDSVSHTSRFEDYTESCANVTRILYATPNQVTTHRVVKLDLGAPTFQRAPGEAPGTFALESAMDELALKLGMDPLELRLKNYAERDPESGRPWSSKSLRECYRVGAEKFGWARRPRTTGAMREGDVLVGYGMASATYPTYRMPASASVRLTADGSGAVRALVQTAAHDLGTGAYTVMTQVAADALGLAPEQVRFELGDSRMPPSPVAGGSMTTASTGSAVHAACMAGRDKLIALAIADTASPLRGALAAAVSAAEGRLFLTEEPTKGESYAALLRRQPNGMMDVRVDSAPGAELAAYAMHAFGAVFVEVRVDRELGEIRIPRIVAAYGAGKILNAKTARSQLEGGIVWGVGMALHEETLVDRRTGRYMNADLAEYHVPVHADIGMIDVTLLDEVDPHVNPIGVKGVGEIGITGVAAAIANAVYNATGVRVRELPITLDKVMGEMRV
ncbi:MAG: xanthine dehydrogenase family protein molybdopterin-binding subunit [Gemmatimonadaceae bacterium]|nr:xanthine dehydrogenase family protein molybdopterin-binding subunit [Gemmatimonadaceae bacterium]